MQKNIFHNKKILDKNTDTKLVKNFPLNYRKKSKYVNINSLLNRVRLNEKNEKIEKLISLGIGVFIIACIGIFIISSK
jgi:hypothetical protein